MGVCANGCAVDAGRGLSPPPTDTHASCLPHAPRLVFGRRHRHEPGLGRVAPFLQQGDLLLPAAPQMRRRPLSPLLLPLLLLPLPDPAQLLRPDLQHGGVSLGEGRFRGRGHRRAAARRALRRLVHLRTCVWLRSVRSRSEGKEGGVCPPSYYYYYVTRIIQKKTSVRCPPDRNHVSGCPNHTPTPPSAPPPSPPRPAPAAASAALAPPRPAPPCAAGASSGPAVGRRWMEGRGRAVGGGG